MIKDINKSPNPVLFQKAVPCALNEKAPGSLLMAVMPKEEQTEIWSEEVVQLVQDLKDTAASLGANCMGLASNQIWDKGTPPPAVFVVRFDAQNGVLWQEFINPEVRTSGRSATHEEACFSKPGRKPKVKKREVNSTIIYQTLKTKAPQITKLLYKDTFAAIVVQHEYDHLCGKLI